MDVRVEGGGSRWIRGGWADVRWSSVWWEKKKGGVTDIQTDIGIYLHTYIHLMDLICIMFSLFSVNAPVGFDSVVIYLLSLLFIYLSM